MRWNIASRASRRSTIIDPVDDNLFVDRARVEAICHGMLERGIKVSWRANCRFDYLARYEGEFLALLEEAGCVELDFGGESGSERMQDFVCKDVTADEILASVEKLHRFAPSIDPFVSWLSGLPGETYADMEQTFDLMDEMERLQPAHAALRDLPLHALPQPAPGGAAAGLHAARVAPGMGRHRGLPLRTPLAQQGLREEAAGRLGRHQICVLSPVPHRRARPELPGGLPGDERGRTHQVAPSCLQLPGRTADGERRCAQASRIPLSQGTQRPAAMDLTSAGGS